MQWNVTIRVARQIAPWSERHKLDQFELRTVIDGQEVMVYLSEVHYAENLTDNIISYGALEERVVSLERHGNHSYVVRLADKMKIFEIFRRNNVLTLDVHCELTRDEQARGISSAVLRVTTRLTKP